MTVLQIARQFTHEAKRADVQLYGDGRIYHQTVKALNAHGITYPTACQLLNHCKAIADRAARKEAATA